MKIEKIKQHLEKLLPQNIKVEIHYDTIQGYQHVDFYWSYGKRVIGLGTLWKGNQPTMTKKRLHSIISKVLEQKVQYEELNQSEIKGWLNEKV